MEQRDQHEICAEVQQEPSEYQNKGELPLILPWKRNGLSLLQNDNVIEKPTSEIIMIINLQDFSLGLLDQFQIFRSVISDGLPMFVIDFFF